jgi:mannose-6-phosphate isomerase-like protein (cupin superfamily)
MTTTEFQQMTREPVHLKRSDWASDARLWRGVLEGKRIGTGVTVLFFSTDEIGKGPRWHVHPYDEIFIVRTGRARFTIGDSAIEATAGDILLGPANVPHKYSNLGPGRLETTDIHVSDRWIQTDLEGPELKEHSEKTAVPA